MRRQANFAVWRLVDRAMAHLIVAHFGVHSATARANLYQAAAGFLCAAADLLLTQAERQRRLGEAERMVSRSYAGE